MNNTIFKFACVFIIAMFCLAPLGAVDLCQDDNNTKYINQENNKTSILVDDKETTDIDADADVSDSNDFDEKASADDSDIKAATEKDSLRTVKDIKVNDTQKLSKSCPNLRAHINTITYGEVPVIEVCAEKNLYARISMECPDFENQYKVPIQDGRMVYQFHEYDLEPGTYEVKVSTIGDSNYDPQEITTKFTVLKMSTNLRVEEIDNIVYGENAVINVAANQKFNGTATLRLLEQQGKFPEKRVPIIFENGKGSVNVEGLGAGYYRAIVEYDGDDHFASACHEKSFIVYGDTSPEVKVNVEDIQYGQHPVVKVHAKESVHGIVEIVTSNSKKSILTDMENGTLECELPEDFEVGNYTVWVKFKGDDTYCPESDYTTFSVEKADPNLRIHVDDANSRDEELHVVVDGNENFNGNVTVTLNNRVWLRQIEVVNGHGEGYYPGGDYPGNYSAKVKFEGNKHFNADESSTTYEVKNI